VQNQLGSFRNNSSHSNQRYGLRIFHGLTPVTNQLGGLGDFTQNNPFVANPPILALFQNFTGFRNGENCMISEATGQVQFDNFKCVDSRTANMEVSVAGLSPQVLVTNAVLVGDSGTITPNLGKN